MRKKFFAAIISFIIFMTAFPKIYVFADSINYIDENGNSKSANATQITSSTTILSGWFYMSGTISTATRFEVNGSAHLILCDGCNLTCNGIHVKEGNNLSIYGQSAKSGILNATDNDCHAAIGGNAGANNGPITINGGTIKAVGRWGAGIGGGGFGGKGSNIKINDGIITFSISRLAKIRTSKLSCSGDDFPII